MKKKTHTHSTVALIALAVLAVFAGSIRQAEAQIAVQMKMNKRSYLLNEPVTATIYVTNNAGRQVVLRSDGNKSWLNFHLTSNGRTIPLTRRVLYRSVVVPVGQTVSRTVNISASYSLGSMGNYTCQATVRLAGPARTGFNSGRALFTITNGRPLWVQRAGVPGSVREVREYKLVSFSANRSLQLYAQVNNANTKRNIVTIPLGDVLSFQKPVARLDRANNMHVLYQIKPDMFTHCVVTLNGRMLTPKLHKRGRMGSPGLVAFRDGSVKVSNSIPYDAKKAAKKRALIRNISERPPFIYRK